MAKMINENDLLPYAASPIPKGPYLVFAPHPDDETLGMGGTITLAAKSGIDVYTVFITNGEKGGDPDIRREEAEAASKILGIKEIFYLNLPDREVLFTPFPDNILIEILEKVKPSTIFLPSFQEIHPDHRAATQKVLNSIEQTKWKFEIWFYEINRQGEINRLIDISSVLDLKESAIECYASQLEQLDYKLHALCLNCMRSVTLGEQTNYAEGFWCYDIKDICAISPERHYFNNLCNYNQQIQHCQQILETENHSATTLDELRKLRDRVNNQLNEIQNYRNLVGILGEHINDKTNEIKLLKQDNNNYIKLVNEFEKKLADIALSKSHKLASTYIKTMVELRKFLKNFRNNRFNLRFSNKSCLNYENSSYKFSQKLKEEEKECSQNGISYPDSKFELTLIQDGEEPVLRLFSENEIKSHVREHDIYLENTNYGNNRVQPLFTDKSVGFFIVCKKSNLARIDLFMATYMRVNPGILILSIYENGELTKKLIRISKLASPTIIDNRFASFDFEPIIESDGKIFYITLSLVDGIYDRCVGLWINTAKKLHYVEKYHQWIEMHEKKNFGNYDEGNEYYNRVYGVELYEKPEITIIVIPQVINLNSFVDNCQKLASETIESILNQSYKQFHLITLNYQEKNSQTDNHIIDNNNICDELNKIIDNTNSEYFLILKQFDTLAPHALDECVKILNKFPDTDLIYSDEDKISEDGVRFDPFFKPCWSYDLFLSSMYIGNFTLFRKQAFQKTGGYSSEFSNCLQYDLLLRLTELTNNIIHIPEILYHKREILLENGEHNLNTIDTFNKSYEFNKEWSIKAIKEAINRRNIDADVSEGQTKNSFRVSYRFNQSNFVSIIIPFKDNYEILNTCIKSILRKTKYPNYEIICVNNQSKNIEKFLEMDICGYGCINNFNSIYKKITIVDYDKPFNYSAINNFAVKHAKGDIILFLNSDTEVISEDWLNAMIEHASRNNVGAVGAKLYYVNDTIQHAGIVVGIAGLAGHAFKHVGRYETNFYHGFPCMIRNVIAVTGACMMTRRSVFEEVGGFDEEYFKVSYNDLDLCLKMRKKGYEIIYTPFAELYHYESYSRGYNFNPIETENIKAKWGKILELDPFYNKNLTIHKEDWSLE